MLKEGKKASPRGEAFDSTAGGFTVENFNELLKKYADFIVRVGVNPQPGRGMFR